MGLTIIFGALGCCNNKSINIDVYPENYLDPTVEDLFRLLANCFKLFCGERYWMIFKDPIESRHRVLGKETYSYITLSPTIVLL